MATTATFSPGSGLLTVIGDAASNTIVTSRDKTGRILVNGGSIKPVGGDPTITNNNEIGIFGEGGNDTINGGAGNDLLALPPMLFELGGQVEPRRTSRSQ